MCVTHICKTRAAKMCGARSAYCLHLSVGHTEVATYCGRNLQKTNGQYSLKCSTAAGFSVPREVAQLGKKNVAIKFTTNPSPAMSWKIGDATNLITTTAATAAAAAAAAVVVAAECAGYEWGVLSSFAATASYVYIKRLSESEPSSRFVIPSLDTSPRRL